MFYIQWLNFWPSSIVGKRHPKCRPSIHPSHINKDVEQLIFYQNLGHSPSFKVHEHSSHSNVQIDEIEVQMHRLSSIIVPNQLDLLYAPW